MPRLNVERTNELKASLENAKYIKEHYPEDVDSCNDGWAVDLVNREYTSKLYKAWVAVTTSMDPPFHTTESPLG